jgi:molecular chaperone HscB
VIDVSHQTDHFEVFGLERCLEVDGGALEAEFLRLSRECHPDRFAGQDAATVAEAQRRSARVNDAYRTLRDPVHRAEHLLELEGVERPEGEAKCPPDLLAEVFDLRERIMENPNDELREEAERMLVTADRRLHGLFAAHDSAAPAERPSLLSEVREALDRRKFLLSLSREVERALGS